MQRHNKSVRDEAVAAARGSVYLEHLTPAVVASIPGPVLSTPTFRGLLDPTGALETGRIGGFNFSQAGAIDLGESVQFGSAQP